MWHLNQLITFVRATNNFLYTILVHMNTHIFPKHHLYTHIIWTTTPSDHWHIHSVLVVMHESIATHIPSHTDHMQLIPHHIPEHDFSHPASLMVSTRAKTNTPLPQFNNKQPLLDNPLTTTTYLLCISHTQHHNICILFRVHPKNHHIWTTNPYAHHYLNDISITDTTKIRAYAYVPSSFTNLHPLLK